MFIIEDPKFQSKIKDSFREYEEKKPVPKREKFNEANLTVSIKNFIKGELAILNPALASYLADKEGYGYTARRCLFGKEKNPDRKATKEIVDLFCYYAYKENYQSCCINERFIPGDPTEYEKLNPDGGLKVNPELVPEAIKTYLQNLRKDTEYVAFPFKDKILDRLHIEDSIQFSFNKPKKINTNPTSETEQALSQFFSASNVLSELHNRKNVLVTGRPGDGKSTFAKWIIYKLVSQVEEIIKLPIYVELKLCRVERHNLFDLISNRLIGLGITEKRTVNVRIYLILDGLDELSKRGEFYEDLKLILRKFNIHSILLTSRFKYDTKDLAYFDFVEYQIRSLSLSEVEEFSKYTLGKDALQFNNLIRNGGFKTFASNKLFLSLILVHFKKGKEFNFKNEGKLLKEIIETDFLQEWESDSYKTEGDKIFGIDYKKVTLALYEIAYLSLKRGSMAVPSVKVRKIIENFLQKERVPSSMIIASRNHILDRLTSSNLINEVDNEFVFSNGVIREVFAASAILKKYYEFPFPLGFYFYYNNYLWNEAFGYFVDLLDNPSPFVKQLYLICKDQVEPTKPFKICVDTIVGNSYIDEELKTKIIHQLDKILQNHFASREKHIHYYRYEYALGMLARIDHPLSNSLFISWLENPIIFKEHLYLNQDVFESHFRFKSTSKYGERIAELILKTDNKEYARVLFPLLRPYQNKEIINIFRNKLKSVKDIAFRVFSDGDSPFWLGNADKIPELIPVFEQVIPIILASENPAIYGGVAFRKAGPVIEREAILPMLDSIEHETDIQKRIKIASALMAISSDIIAPSLYKYLGVRDLGEAILYSLRVVNIPEDFEDQLFRKIFQLFSKSGKLFQVNALVTWGERRTKKNEREIELVISLLKSADGHIRGHAAEALGKQKVSSANVELFNALLVEKLDLPLAMMANAIMEIDITYYRIFMQLSIDESYKNDLKSEDEAVVTRALFMLKYVGTERSIESINKVSDLRGELKLNQGEVLNAINERMERYKRTVAKN